LLYTEPHAAKWIFPQEKATFHDSGKGKSTGEPLYAGTGLAVFAAGLKQA